MYGTFCQRFGGLSDDTLNGSNHFSPFAKQNLKSAEELEEEERAAQSAKLQELIRRGTPADLQEANQLMKVMAGYDQSTKTDYRQKAAEDIAKLQEKQKLLDEMLAKVKKGETIGQQDAFEVCGPLPLSFSLGLFLMLIIP